MKKYKQIIDGHECEFQIYGNGSQFAGQVRIKEPCLSENMIFTERDKHYSTEVYVREFLENKVKKIFENPMYFHPKIASQMQPIGSNCKLCGRQIQSGDGWSDVS